MPQFAYTARDDAGVSSQGVITAPSRIEAARQLRVDGKYVVRVEPATGKSARPAKSAEAADQTVRKSSRSGKFRPDDLIYFTNQLAVMIDTGVPLSDALDGCVGPSNSPAFERALTGVIENVRGGQEFSTALAAYPRIFPTIYVNLIKASEASGMMGPMLRRLADFLEAQRDQARKIKGAITYPIVMVVFSIGVTIFLMTFVLPKFAEIYAGREDTLPVLTRGLMSFSHFLVGYGLYLLGALAAAGVGLYFTFRSDAGKRRAESIKLRLPLFGPLLHKTYLSRSLRTLGTMITSGVSMLEGIRLTSAACGSRFYEQMWNQVNARLETGQQLSEALAEHDAIPRPVNRMLSAGEKAGQLGSVMERVAMFCEAELNAALKALNAMIEPAIVTMLGLVIGFLVLALLLPIFTISKALK